MLENHSSLAAYVRTRSRTNVLPRVLPPADHKTACFIVGNGNIRASPSKVASVKDWLLPETQKKIKSFVASCSFNRKFIHHFVDCSAPLTNLCRKSLPGRVVHFDSTRAAFETLKARMISAPVLLIPKSGRDTEFIVAIDASKVGVAGVLFQEDSECHLRPCVY